MQNEQKTKGSKPAKVDKIIRSVVMRVTENEAGRLKYQRKFDKAWAKEQAHDAALFAIGQDQRDCYSQSALTSTPCLMGGVIIHNLAETEQDEQENRDRVAFNF